MCKVFTQDLKLLQGFNIVSIQHFSVYNINFKPCEIGCFFYSKVKLPYSKIGCNNDLYTDKYVNASVVIFEKVCLIRPSLALLTTANIDLLDYNNTLDLPM